MSRLNGIPEPSKSFRDISETEFTQWLARVDFAKQKKENEKKLKINPPSKQERCSSSRSKKSNVVNLQFSLEDNSTLIGIAAILEQFGKEFSIPCHHNNEICFDKKFDLKAKRDALAHTKNTSVNLCQMMLTLDQILILWIA